MTLLDLTLGTAAENLALDEALLQHAETGDDAECLRFWMSPSHFVVVGIGARTEREVHVQACQSQGIPVIRRCSGGGTVVQGPGCLNYSLVLKIPAEGPLSSIRATNQFVMRCHAEAMAALISRSVQVQGHTDLAIAGRKFSGNAQRRLRRHLLFHGTLLLNFDLNLIPELLPLPTTQPDYRQSRTHTEFLMNLNVPVEVVKRALKDAWQATDPAPEPPLDATSRLVAQRYGCDAWNFRT